MKINGIEELKLIEDSVKEFLERVYNSAPEITIEKTDDFEYLVTDNDLIDDNYIIISEYDEQNYLYEEADNIFYDHIYEVPRNWRGYIDKDAWIEDNCELENFESYWSETHDHSIEFIDSINNVNFYKEEK
jgi:hypothetical protein